MPAESGSGPPHGNEETNRELRALEKKAAVALSCGSVEAELSEADSWLELAERAASLVEAISGVDAQTIHKKITRDGEAWPIGLSQDLEIELDRRFPAPQEDDDEEQPVPTVNQQLEPVVRAELLATQSAPSDGHESLMSRRIERLCDTSVFVRKIMPKLQNQLGGDEGPWRAVWVAGLHVGMNYLESVIGAMDAGKCTSSFELRRAMRQVRFAILGVVRVLRKKNEEELSDFKEDMGDFESGAEHPLAAESDAHTQRLFDLSARVFDVYSQSDSRNFDSNDADIAFGPLVKPYPGLARLGEIADFLARVRCTVGDERATHVMLRAENYWVV